MGETTFHNVAFDGGAKVAARAIDSARVATIPWYVWCLAIAVVLDAFGGYWDISWHISIGRDTFWTPAHMVVYLAGNPGRNRVRLHNSGDHLWLIARGAGKSVVTIWGFRGPLGCFIAAWGAIRDAHLGAIRQLVARRIRPRRKNCQPAAFDPWAGRGDDQPRRDAAGVRATQSRVGRVSKETRSPAAVTSAGSRSSAPRCSRWNRRRWSSCTAAAFYRAMARTFPIVLIAHYLRFEIEVAGDHNGRHLHAAASSRCCGSSRCFLPQPKLGPVYQHITHMVPLWFPTLLIVPAFALDLLRQRMGELGWFEVGSRGGVRVSGSVHRGAMAVREFSDFAAGAQPNLRHDLFRLLRSRQPVLQPLRIRAYRQNARGDVTRNDRRVGDIDHVLFDRDGARKLDAQSPALIGKLRMPPPLRLTKKRVVCARLVAMLAAAIVAFASTASAHVGSPNVFYEGDAGPYHLFVTVRVPQVIPGVAEVEIRAQLRRRAEIHATSVARLTGPGSKLRAGSRPGQAIENRPAIFTSSLWLMEYGSLRVQLKVNGTHGPATMSVPVASFARKMLPMPKLARRDSAGVDDRACNRRGLDRGRGGA